MEKSLQFLVISWLFLSSFNSFTTVVGTKAQELQNNADQKLDLISEYRRIRRDVGPDIEVNGRITFKGKAPRTIPPNSQLNVKFIDIINADALHIELASILVDLTNYKNTTPVFYNLTCKRPVDLHDMHSVVAVLNMGWIPKGGENDEWLRHGDYHNTHSFMVNVTSRNDNFVRDIEMEMFGSSTSAVQWGKDKPDGEMEKEIYAASSTSSAVLLRKDTVLQAVIFLFMALFLPS